jgi:FdhD protein
VVTEEPLEIRLGWPGAGPVRLAVTMRTPGADFELAAGFLLSERVLDLGDVPRSIAYCLDSTLTSDQRYNVVTATLDRPPRRLPSARFTAVSSACGVCGTQSLEEVFAPDEPALPLVDTVSATVVVAAPGELGHAQPTFRQTGAVHAAGIFDFDGRCRIVREDIGRHNAVDKVLGARALGAASYGESSLLCVSGRIGFDIVSKALAGRIAVVVGVGGPSSLAVDLAERAGVTVCGFARNGRYVIYSHPGRVRGV